MSFVSLFKIHLYLLYPSVTFCICTLKRRVTECAATVKYFSPATATFILRVSRDHYRLVWSALACLTRLPPEGAPCVMRVVRVSGTIRKSVEEAVRRARVGMERARLDGQSDRTREMGITGMAGVNGDGDGDGDEDEDGSEGE